MWQKTRVFGPAIGEVIVMRFDTVPECDRRTDGQTDGHRCSGNTNACMACYATDVVKTEVLVLVLKIKIHVYSIGINCISLHNVICNTVMLKIMTDEIGLHRATINAPAGSRSIIMKFFKTFFCFRPPIYERVRHTDRRAQRRTKSSAARKTDLIRSK